MAKKCPPGIICIENFTFTFFGLLILIVLFFLYINFNKTNNILNKSSCDCNIPGECKKQKNKDIFLKSDYSHMNINNDVLLNPYSAPMRDNRLFNSENYNGLKIPINQPTQSIDTNYRQIGILTRVHGGETILPLMGRPLFSNKDKWNFYTMNDKNNMIKLPITFKNKSCTSDLGCDNVYNGDTVYVEGYNDLFRVTVYDNNVMQYIPYL